MGSGHKAFNLNEVLTSADVNNYLMKQTVMCFNSAAARDAAITSPEEGMHAYLRDTDVDTIYTGSAWKESDPTPPTAILRSSVTQTISRDTDTPITFDTEDIDSHNGHSTSSNTSRYVVPRSGIYSVSGAVTWPSTSMTAKLEAFFRVNGSASEHYAGSTVYRTTAHSGTPVNDLSCLMRLNAGDYIELMAYHNAVDGSSAVIFSLDTAHTYKKGCRFEIEWRRPL